MKIRQQACLMIGITRIDGFFKSGDIVRIVDEKGNNIGLGKVAV